MSPVLTRLAVVALPVVALLGAWANTHLMAQRGTDWIVPIKGHDPRDVLRGHYIRFEYDWPLGNDGVEPGLNSHICITGTAPTVKAARVTSISAEEDHCTSIVRPGGWMEATSEDGVTRDRIYVPQTQAAGLEAQLRDPKLQGLVTMRVRGDGVARPLSLSFRARPVVE